MQMDDVGFLKLTQFGDVGAGIGDVDLEKVFPGEVQSAENDLPLPKEMPMKH